MKTTLIKLKTTETIKTTNIMKTMKTIKFLAVSVLFLTLFASCSDDDNPEPVNEEEVITTLRLTLTPQGGGAPIIFLSQDLDGDGPDQPIVIDELTLDAATTYTGSIEVLNELEVPVENKTAEIAEEDDEHQFFYSFIGAAGSSIAYVDFDDNGNPLGLNITFTTGPASTTNNTLTITLLHEPNKSAAGVNMGDMANAGGEEDIVVSFDFFIN